MVCWKMQITSIIIRFFMPFKWIVLVEVTDPGWKPDSESMDDSD